MDCKQCEALLDQRQKDTLDHEERREMQAHLDTCQACQMRLAVLESLRTMDEGDEVPISFSQGWRQKIQAEGVQKKKVTLAKASRWLAVAAALVLVVGGTFITGQNRRGTSTVDALPAYSADIGDLAGSFESEASPISPPMSYAPKREMAEPSLKDDAKIIRTVNLEMSTRAFDEDYPAILRILDQNSGSVQNTSLYVGNADLRTAYITLRVPSGKLDSLTQAVRNLGRLISYSESSDDVSETYADLDSRLTTQQSKMERLLVLLSKAETVEDLIAIETSISDTQYEIDRLTGQLQSIDSRVSLSTVNITLSEASARETSETRGETLMARIKSGITAAWQGFVAVLGDFVVFMSVSLPYLLILLTLILIIRYIIRRRKNK